MLGIPGMIQDTLGVSMHEWRKAPGVRGEARRKCQKGSMQFLGVPKRALRAWAVKRCQARHESSPIWHNMAKIGEVPPNYCIRMIVYESQSWTEVDGHRRT